MVQGCSGTPSALFWTPLSPTSAACPPLLFSRLLIIFPLHSSVRWDVSCCVLLLIFFYYQIYLVSHLITYKTVTKQTKQDWSGQIYKTDFCMHQLFWYIDFFAMPGVNSALLFFCILLPPYLFQNSPFVIPWSSSLERWERKCHLKGDPLVAFILLKTEQKPQ